ncbi:MAG: hypothetical protein KDJ29_21195, partial [Hyphomicrobiales bacterium]|nr:hypothetical protein [Hyphomicrobiales bacterium]
MASARSLSGDPQMEFSEEFGETLSARLRLHGSSTNSSAIELEISAARGEADADAAFLRYHDPQLHATLRPAETDEARLFDLMEHARCEGRAARAYPGLIANLTALHHARLARADLLNAHLASLLPLAEALRMVLRDSFAGLREPSIQTAGFRMWDSWLRARFSSQIDELVAALPDQRKYAQSSSAFLADLFRELPSRGREIRRLTPSQPEESTGENERALRETDDPTRAAIFDPGDKIGLELDQFRQGLQAGPALPAPYRQFTTRHDRTVRAEEMFDRGTLNGSRQVLDEKRAAFRREVSKLSARLQRRLLAKQTREWEFDLDEGLIDASRLDRVILSPGFAAAYKMETESPFRDTLVTLLIDNSGSMRGKPIETACITADIVSAALERCSVTTEILGYTTCE